MKARIDYTNVPEALRGMYQLEHYIHNSGLEESLVHLVKMRASQINGCAYCLDVHSKDARALGETEQRLFVLDAWEEAAFYSERERAALALTEAVTRITEGHVPDAVFERARAHFNEQELIALVFTLTTIPQPLKIRGSSLPLDNFSMGISFDRKRRRRSGCSQRDVAS